MKPLYRVRNTTTQPQTVNNTVINPGRGILATVLTEEILSLKSANKVHVKPLHPVEDSDVANTLPADLTDSTGGVAAAEVPAFNATTYTPAELNNFAATVVAQLNGISAQVAALIVAINAGGGFDASVDDILQNVIDTTTK